MGLFEKLFGNNPKKAMLEEANQTFQTLTAYRPVFSSWSGKIYESELVRAAIDARARHISKLKVEAVGAALPALQRSFRYEPNTFQTWSQFLYRLSTILDVQNTAIIVPFRDRAGRLVGVFPVLPTTCEIKGSTDSPILRFKFPNGKTADEYLSNCGIMTKFQYDDDFFGSYNTALQNTMNLINMQNQGITEGIKNAATFRFMARVTNFTKPSDLTNEQSRFNKSQLQGESGGVILFPNTYSDIKEVSSTPFVVDDKQVQIIQNNVFRYFGVNSAVLDNSADGNALDSFYNGAIEPFVVQLADVLTKMLFTVDERKSYGNEIKVTANRLQYMSVQNKINMATQLGDRGYIMIDEARELFNYEPLPDGLGQQSPVRGEYYMLQDKQGASSELLPQDKSESDNAEEAETDASEE